MFSKRSPSIVVLSLLLPCLVGWSSNRDSLVAIESGGTTINLYLTVERIVTVPLADGGYQFQITLHNHARKQTSISQIVVEASKSEHENYKCYDPSRSKIRIETKVDVSGSDQGTETMVKSFTDEIHKTKYVVDASGSYSGQSCGGTRSGRLNLRLLTAIPLPRAEFTYLVVDLPAVFEPVASPGLTQEQARNLKRYWSVRLDTFSECLFTFRTTDPEERDFAGNGQIPRGQSRRNSAPSVIALGRTQDQVVAVTFQNGKVSDVQ